MCVDAMYHRRPPRAIQNLISEILCEFLRRWPNVLELGHQYITVSQVLKACLEDTMPRFLRERSHYYIVGLLLCALPLLASCTPNANAQILSPELGERLTAELAGETIAAPTPPPPLAALTLEEQIAGLADEASGIAQLISTGAANPDNGPALAAENACTGCHLLDPDAVASGPTWYNLGNASVGRNSNQSPAHYLYASIAAPNDYIVRGYQEGVMPQNYLDVLSEQDFADLIVYIMEQQQETPADFDPAAAEGEAITDTATMTGAEALTDTEGMTDTQSVTSTETVTGM